MKELAKQLLTPKGFEVFESVEKVLTPVWDRSSSSSMKYHKRADGTVQDIEEHTKEMLRAAGKISRMFDGSPLDNDILYLAILLHDSLKYGMSGDARHTTSLHDQLAGNIVRLLRPGAGYYSSGQLLILENMVLFIHMLDMLSTADCLKL